MVEEITAPGNRRVKDWAKLQTSRGRKKQHRYLLEGWHLVKEALAAQVVISELIIVADEISLLDDLSVPGDCEVVTITREIAQKISSTPSPQGVFAVAPLVDQQPVTPSQAQGAWLFLDGIQDPGNIGTMVRTADAAGFNGVVFGPGTADYHQPKIMRSMQGSQFHLHLVTTPDLGEWVTTFRDRKIPVFGSELNVNARDYRTVGQHQDFALVMGNEGNGMSADLLHQTAMNLYIPIAGQAESLNVAVAAGILMFQLIGG